MIKSYIITIYFLLDSYILDTSLRSVWQKMGYSVWRYFFIFWIATNLLRKFSQWRWNFVILMLAIFVGLRKRSDRSIQRFVQNRVMLQSRVICRIFVLDTSAFSKPQYDKKTNQKNFSSLSMKILFDILFVLTYHKKQVLPADSAKKPTRKHSKILKTKS